VTWTWESLTAANKATFAELMRTGEIPQIGQLVGHTYRGLNRGLLPKLTGERFKKVFYVEGGEPLGHNVVERRGRQVEAGWFRLRPADRSVRIDYDVERNRGWDLPIRLLQDFVVLPNPGDHALVLGKAYYARVPVAYFILERET
jgi:hypothetical protein